VRRKGGRRGRPLAGTRDGSHYSALVRATRHTNGMGEVGTLPPKSAASPAGGRRGFVHLGSHTRSSFEPRPASGPMSVTAQKGQQVGMSERCGAGRRGGLQQFFRAIKNPGREPGSKRKEKPDQQYRFWVKTTTLTRASCACVRAPACQRQIPVHKTSTGGQVRRCLLVQYRSWSRGCTSKRWNQSQPCLWPTPSLILSA